MFKNDNVKRLLDENGFKLNKVDNILEWVDKSYPSENYFRIYMGNSLSDYSIMKAVNYSMCSPGAHWIIKNAVNYITYYESGDKAITDCLMRIYQVFFHKNNEQLIDFLQMIKAGFNFLSVYFNKLKEVRVYESRLKECKDELDKIKEVFFDKDSGIGIIRDLFQEYSLISSDKKIKIEDPLIEWNDKWVILFNNEKVALDEFIERYIFFGLYKFYDKEKDL